MFLLDLSVPIIVLSIGETMDELLVALLQLISLFEASELLGNGNSKKIIQISEM